jgi:hypothetical protein
MKSKIALLSTFLFLFMYSMNGQEKRQKTLFIETGMDFISCTAPDKDYIRADVNPDPLYYEPSYIRALMYKNYVGIKAGVKVMNNMIGLAGGIRFTRMESTIGKDEYWSSRTNYLYMLFQQQNTSTNYLRIKDIDQITDYMGIPVEMRIYPYKYKFVQMYYSIGLDINIRVSNKVNIHFLDASMEKYEDKAAGIIEDPWSVYSTLYVAAGLKIGKENKPNACIEAHAPAFILADFHNSFVTPEFGGGIQLNVCIPF